MSKAWTNGSTRQWRRVRAAVLAHNRLPVRLGGNDGRCVRQIPGVCTGQADQAHHVLGKANGDDARYLEAVCGACNRAIGDPLAKEPRPKILSRWTR